MSAPQIESLCVIGDDNPDDLSIIENPAYPDACAELARLTGWTSATVRFADGGTLHGSADQVRPLLARLGEA